MASQPPPYNQGNQPYPPPPANYGQPAQPAYGYSGYGQPGTTVILTQPMPMRESPVNMTCPNCRNQIVTSTHHQTGTLTWVACLVLCLIGCDVGCCFIPFCVNSCKDTVHTCPSCRTTLGKHNKM